MKPPKLPSAERGPTKPALRMRKIRIAGKSAYGATNPTAFGAGSPSAFPTSGES